MESASTSNGSVERAKDTQRRERAVVSTAFCLPDVASRVRPILEGYKWADEGCGAAWQYVSERLQAREMPDVAEAMNLSADQGWSMAEIVAEEPHATTEGAVRAAHALSDAHHRVSIAAMLEYATQAVRSGEKPLRQVLSILEGECRKGIKRASFSVARELEEIAADALDPARHDPERRLSTGLLDLDYLLDGGYSPGNLCVVGARPSMGKTTLAVNLAVEHLNAGRSVVLSTLEMTDVEILESTVQCMTANPRSLKQAVLSGDMKALQSFDRGFGVVCKLPLSVCAARTVGDLEAELDRHEAKFGFPDVLLVDYLQLMESERKVESRQQEVASVSRALKLLARDRELAVVLLSQLNRANQARATKQPLLSDLRESGAIEQDADQVLLLHRPDYYDPDDRPGLCEIHVAKNRHGRTGMAEVTFDRGRKIFQDREQG